MATATFSFAGRLPGVACAPASPAVTEPVRLDVAAFVGFAATGPLDRPVVVEDTPQFEAWFGPDVALCVDGAGVPRYAHLAAAVRAFFDNGGRRAHVVRVAGATARPTRWTLPGVAAWRREAGPGGATITTVRPARIESAWAGVTLNRSSVDTAVTAVPLPADGGYARPAGTVAPAAPSRLPVRRGAHAVLRVGDLVRIDLEAAASPEAGEPAPPRVLLLRVAAVQAGALIFDAEFPAEPVAGVALPGADIPGGIPEATGGLVPAPGYEPEAAVTLRTRRVVLLRFEITVHDRRPGRAPESTRLRDLSFGEWAAELEAEAGDHRPGSPVRATPETAADVAGLAPGPAGLTVPVPVPPGGPRPVPPDQAGRDGLDGFDLSVFADPRFTASTVTGLTTDVEAVLLERTEPGFRGLHAIYPVEEVALVAVPDALHRGWAPAPPPVPDPPPAEPVAPPTDWSDFRACTVAGVPVGEPVAPTPEPAGPPPPIPESPAIPESLPLQHQAAGYEPGPLLALQRALITLCAARADAVALLSLPEHLDPPGVVDWMARLRSDPALTDRGSIGAPALSHAATYHPWLSVVEPVTPGLSRLRVVPPEGAVAGMIAAREAAAGPWAAPAHIPLRGVVLAASVPDQDTTLRLLDAHTNLVVPRPGAFVTIGAHTLTADPHSRQLSVRRLLILLRTVAERIGRRYVFEPNGEQLRTTIRLRFARLLEHLLERGAIRAFTVSVDGSGALDGLLVVRVQVAPYEPIEFITVTLVRTGEGLISVGEG